MSRAPRSRIPWLRIALVIPGMAIAAGVIADPVSITAALQGWVLAAIALAIAALALVAARRALRAKKESAAGATRLLDLASTRFDSDGSAHQRVRLALLAVFVTGGAHVLLQAWLDERAESSRSWDSEVMDVAGSQRWHSQRIGRLAIASATASADPVAVAGELRSALDRAKRDAQRLEQLLNALPAAPLQNHGARSPVSTFSVASWCSRAATTARRCCMRALMSAGTPSLFSRLAMALAMSAGDK